MSVSSSSSMPELEEVNSQLSAVEAGLAALDRHKTSLHQHADNVKQDISSAVEHHMATLRAREKQLIRQVELVSTHQSCRLNVTQAQLLQHQGALAVTRTILHRCQKGTDSTAINSAQCCSEAEPCCRQNLQKSAVSTRRCYGDLEDDERRSCGADDCSDLCVYSSKSETSSDGSHTDNCVSHRDVNGLMRQAEKLLHVPLISVTQLEDPAINTAIQNLGSVTLPPTSGDLLPLPHCELLPHSELLPHCLEEYGDADHHVLHKSVRPDSCEPIDVRQPYLIAAKARRSFKKSSGAQQSQESGLADQNMAADKNEDLVKWLRRMQLDTPTRRPVLPKECAEVCVEEACQGNEVCSSFSECFLNGQCQKSATEKLDQSSKWRLQQQQQEAQSSQLLLLHQNFLLHKLKKQVLGEAQTNVQTLQTAGWVMPSNVARKRVLSGQASAIQPVIAHMNAIQRSSNGSWLLMTGTNGLDGSVAGLNLNSNKRENGFSAAPQAQDQWMNKKMRKDEAKVVGDATFRSAILYQAPTAQWRLDSEAKKDQKCNDDVGKPTKKLPESEDVVDEDEGGESRTIKNDWLLKKCDLKSSPKKSALEKTLTDNENSNLFLAGRIKSQLSLPSKTNIENVKERIDKLIAEAERQRNETTTSGKEEFRKDEKDAWLLQQSPAQQADNKILEEIMERKSEWLSTSSQASFSVISESESRGSWLMS